MAKKATVSLILCLLLVIGCGKEIFHGLNEQQANSMILLLKMNGIEGIKYIEKSARGDSWTIQVPSAQETQALMLVHQHHLPRKTHHGFEEIYQEKSLIPSSSEEKARYLDALCEEIAETLEIADEILQARVHLAIPDKEKFRFNEKNDKNPTASVLIKTKNESTNTIDNDRIRMLVSNSVTDLTPDNVEIIKIFSTSDTSSIKFPNRRFDDRRNLYKSIVVVALSMAIILGIFVIVLLRKIKRFNHQKTAVVKSGSNHGKID